MRIKLWMLLSSLLFLAGHSRSTAGEASRSGDLPYRVLVVIGDQWADPGSYKIDGASGFSETSRESHRDFRDVITMLKVWGIPFDILRLDQQRLQINRFLNGVAGPNYSCVIWMADPGKLKSFAANYETLRRAVEQYGMSLIALFDCVATPEVAALIGVEFESVSTATVGSALTIAGEHPVTAGLAGEVVRDDPKSDLRVIHCRAHSATVVLGTLEGQPQLAVREITDRTKAVWVGGGRDWFGKFPVMRKLFRRALVYAMGYGLFNDGFENAFIFIMDDMGASEHAYSLRWHYPTPSREAIVKYLVEPLEEKGFVMVQNVTPGYANPVTRMVENPWTIQRFTDPFGNVQDYGSTKEGLDEGVRRGVFEIHAHRAWTHKTWDLDSPPGPWWDAPIDGERAHSGWYNEVYDTRRGVPVPSNDLLFIYRVGRDAIERQFGVVPLGVTVRPSSSLEYDTGRLAAIAGYGVGRLHYIGSDFVIQFSIPEMCPEQFTCHDLDLVARHPSEITGPERNVRLETGAALMAARVVGTRSVDLRSREWIESRKDKRWIGFNEYCAYLHSRIAARLGDGLRMQLEYDPHYCRHFGTNPSNWTLELSDRYRRKLGSKVTITIDGKKQSHALSERQTIMIPAGVGPHVVDIRPE